MSPASDSSQASATFDDVPRVLILDILMRVSLGQRIRCTLVCKGWGALINDLGFWSELSFDGSISRRSDKYEVLKQVCRRSAGQLRVLDLSFGNCFVDIDTVPFLDFLEELAAQGLNGKLETIHGRLRIKNTSEAERLRSACPALRSVRARLEGLPSDAIAALRVLSGVLSDRGEFVPNGCTYGRNAIVESDEHFANSLSEALSVSSVASADFSFVSCPDAAAAFMIPWDAHHELSTPASRRLLRAAANRLAAALAHPVHGTHIVDDSGRTWQPSTDSDRDRQRWLTIPLIKALTPDSPLRELSCRNVGDVTTAAEMAAALCSALASNRSRLAVLRIAD